MDGKSLTWRVWYTDGSSVDNTQVNDLSELPSWDVQAVVFLDPVYNRIVLDRKDFYLYHREHRWLPCSEFGFMETVVNRIGDIEKVLAGATTSRAQYEDVLRKARNDPEFPAQGGGLPPFSRQD